MNRKRVTRIFCVLFSICFLAGCSNRAADTADSESEGYIKLYYLNPEGTRLVSAGYELVTIDQPVKNQIEEVIGMLGYQSAQLQYKVTISPDVNFLGVKTHDSYVSLDFDSGYSRMDSITEVLVRAALVRTLVQLEDVSHIEITVNGQPLTDHNEQIVGIMSEEMFVDNNNKDGNYNQYGEVTLYFASETGDRLKEYSVQMEVSNNLPIEQLIIEQLILGPDKEGFLGTIPKGTQINKTSVKEGVCYVDFNSKITDALSEVTDEVTIYSIVNSLVELPTVNKVQFTIDGLKVEKYRETMAFDGLFERKLELIEDKK